MQIYGKWESRNAPCVQRGYGTVVDCETVYLYLYIRKMYPKMLLNFFQFLFLILICFVSVILYFLNDSNIVLF